MESKPLDLDRRVPKVFRFGFQQIPWLYSHIQVDLSLAGPTDTIAKGSDSICKC